MENACVIGYGVVGQATAKLFGIKKYFDLKGSTITLEEASKCKFVFICLPTEINQDGTYITTDIEQIFRQIEDYGGAGIYIIRSTVWPGFAKHLSNNLGIDRIVSNPEFLSEDTAERDTKHPPFVVLGGMPKYITEVQALYNGRIKAAEFILTDNITAEMAKLALNGFFATKVIYANEIYDGCRNLKANYERVREVLERHPFGYRNHATIWYKGKRGVNGKCLPKDSKALGRYTGGELIKRVVELNEKYIYQKYED